MFSASLRWCNDMEPYPSDIMQGVLQSVRRRETGITKEAESTLPLFIVGRIKGRCKWSVDAVVECLGIIDGNWFAILQGWAPFRTLNRFYGRLIEQATSRFQYCDVWNGPMLIDTEIYHHICLKSAALCSKRVKRIVCQCFYSSYRLRAAALLTGFRLGKKITSTDNHEENRKHRCFCSHVSLLDSLCVHAHQYRIFQSICQLTANIAYLLLLYYLHIVFKEL